MKKFVFIATCLAVLFALAAPSAYAEGYGGFRAGAIRAVFVGDDSEAAPWSRTGFTGGAFLGFDTGGHLGFRTDFLYTMKGGSGYGLIVPIDFLEFQPVSTSTIKVDYLEFAPLLVARFSLPGRFSIRGFVGPVIGLWINAEQASTLEVGGQEYQIDVDLGEVVEHWEVSGTIGAELNASVGPYVVLLESRYTQGSRVFESVGLNGEPLNLNLSNSGISIMAGLMVPF